MAAISFSGRAEDCVQAVQGVRAISEKNSVRIVSTARVPVNATDEESIQIAGSEGEMKAKKQLLTYRTNKKIVTGTFSGVILRGSCVSGGYLYVTVETSESLRRNSGNLKQQIEESLSRTPTPKPQ
jgi:hypothetical protein